MQPARVTFAGYLQLVRSNHNFRRLWLAQIVSEIGDWFYSVAIFAFLLDTVGTAESVALAFLCQVLPQTLVSPAAGVINDRLSRRRVMLFADWSRVVIVGCMLLVRGRDTVWLLYTLLVLETVMWALFEPGRSAVIPNIVPERDIPAANALSSTTWSVNFMVGSALGGLVATRYGRDTVFVLNALSFAASALFIWRMRFNEAHAERVRLRAADLLGLQPVREGIAYVRKDPRRLAVMLVKTGLGLMGTNWVIIPLLGERVFRVQLGGYNARQAGTMGMSVLLAARGLGALIGGFAATGFAGNSSRRLRSVIFAGFLLGAAGYCGLSVAPHAVLAVAALIVAHAGGSGIWVSSTTLLQQLTHDRFRGRVFSAEFAFLMFTVGSAGYAAGFAVDHGVGVRTMALITGIAMLLPAALWSLAQRLWLTDFSAAAKPDRLTPGKRHEQ
jgi:MFS family permease